MGLLAYWDERASWLANCISSYAEAGITHMVVSDGPYALFPTERVRSHPDARDAILDTCISHGLPVHYHEQDVKWQGGEIEKRTHMFRMAETLTQPLVDWLCVMDADEVVADYPPDLARALAATDRDAGDVQQREPWPRDTPSQRQVDRAKAHPRVTVSTQRKLFRAIPGLHCAGNHYTYRTPDGIDLWGQREKRMAPGLDLTATFVVDHLTHYRSLERANAQADYYAARDTARIETP